MSKLQEVVAQAALHPKVAESGNWINPLFTGVVFTLTPEQWLKVAAFVFISLPLGVIQWWNLVDKLKERRARKNAAAR